MSLHSPLVPMLIAQEVNDEAEKNTANIRRFKEQYPALLLTPIQGKFKNITTAQQVVLKAIFETPVLFSTRAESLMEVYAHPIGAKIMLA